jgi:hypothetical protein
MIKVFHTITKKNAIHAIITYDSPSRAHNVESRNARGGILFPLNAFRRLYA